MYQVLVSATFQKQFDRLPLDAIKRIRKALKELEKDPIDPRPGADIKQLKDTDPPKHRLRIGEYRVIYLVEKNHVKVIDVFIRCRGHRE